MNRVDELGADYFHALALKETFSGSEEGYVDRENTYHGMPKELSVEEVTSLVRHIGKNLEGLKPVSRIYEAEARAVNWLGTVSLRNGDAVTVESIRQVVESQPQLIIKNRAIRFRLPGNLFRSA